MISRIQYILNLGPTPWKYSFLHMWPLVDLCYSPVSRIIFQSLAQPSCFVGECNSELWQEVACLVLCCVHGKVLLRFSALNEIIPMCKDCQLTGPRSISVSSEKAKLMAGEHTGSRHEIVCSQESTLCPDNNPESGCRLGYHDSLGG